MLCFLGKPGKIVNQCQFFVEAKKSMGPHFFLSFFGLLFTSLGKVKDMRKIDRCFSACLKYCVYNTTKRNISGIWKKEGLIFFICLTLPSEVNDQPKKVQKNVGANGVFGLDKKLTLVDNFAWFT